MTATLPRPRPTRATRLRSPRRLPDALPSEPVCRISVEQYHEMIRQGILVEGEPIELLEGWLVRKMSKNPLHVLVSKRLRKALERTLPKGWELYSQDPITLESSEPEPGLAIVLESKSEYRQQHPTAQETGLVIEVAESSLSRDKGWKKRVYAEASIPQYWVVNLVQSVIEVFSDPTGASKSPDYRMAQVFSAKQKVPVILNGKKVGSILVADVLP